MRRHPTLAAALSIPSAAILLLVASAAAQPAAPAPGPSIEMAPPDEPRQAIPRPAGLDLQRESDIEVPLAVGLAADRPVGAATAIGGYGEITINAPTNDDPAIADVRRLVLFVGHNFTERLRVYTELEMEHAITSADDRGEFEVEQLFVDYLARRWLNLRAGLILMPVGIVNQFHEPPTFNGVNRPETDTRIIPSTWREVGAGVFGAVGPLRWQVYGVTSFKARDFDAEGLREGHQEGQLARARDWGVVARLDLAPTPGLSIGASGYYADSGQADASLGGARAGLGLVEADVRVRWKGLEARAEVVNVWINDTPPINAARKADFDEAQMDPTSPQFGATFEAVSHQLRGGYVELGYNLLHPLHLTYSSSLVVFGRYERTNTQADVTDYAAATSRDRQLITAGLNYRPVAEVALKADIEHITAYTSGASSNPSWSQFNLGLAFMF